MKDFIANNQHLEFHPKNYWQPDATHDTNGTNSVNGRTDLPIIVNYQPYENTEKLHEIKPIGNTKSFFSTALITNSIALYRILADSSTQPQENN